LKEIAVKILALIVLNPLVLASILIPLKAEASVFSFMKSFFSSAQAEEVVFPNSQNMTLLEAHPSPSGQARLNRELAIESGTSLSPQESVNPNSDVKTVMNDQIS